MKGTWICQILDQENWRGLFGQLGGLHKVTRLMNKIKLLMVSYV